MPSIDDFKDDPPTPHECMKHGDFVPITSRCTEHPDTYSDCYHCHLEKDHRPQEDKFYGNMKYTKPDQPTIVA